MSTLELAFRSDLWLRLDGPPADRETLLAERLASAPPDWTAGDLSAIVARADSAPAFTADAARLLLIAEDRSWFVLEVSVLSGEESAPLDPVTDLEGLNAEAVRLSPDLSGYRLVTMESAGPFDGLPGPDAELLLPRLHYFLRVGGDELSWLYAGMQIPDPRDLASVVPLVEELLQGVGRT